MIIEIITGILKKGINTYFYQNELINKYLMFLNVRFF